MEGAETYRLVRVDAKKAGSVARLIDRHACVEEVCVRGIADAVRAGEGETPSFVPDEAGYFEETVAAFGDAVSVLPSLTRFVAYTGSGSAVFSWREDGQVYLRATPGGALLGAVRDEGLEPEVASGIHEGVLAEDEGNRKAEEEREGE